jgi:hypothetical protein
MCGSPNVPDPEPAPPPAPLPPPPPPPETKEAIQAAPEKTAEKRTGRTQLTIKKQNQMGGTSNTGAGGGLNA